MALLTDFQRIFVKVACDLKEHIIDFEIDDKEFIERYNLNKNQVRKEIGKLRGKI